MDFAELQGRFKKDFEIKQVTQLPELVRNGGDGWSNTAQWNSGPFRVYQIAGYYNWREGLYDSAKWGNNGSVARTLHIEHVMDRPRLQGPFSDMAG